MIEFLREQGAKGGRIGGKRSLQRHRRAAIRTGQGQPGGCEGAAGEAKKRPEGFAEGCADSPGDVLKAPAGELRVRPHSA